MSLNNFDNTNNMATNGKVDPTPTPSGAKIEIPSPQSILQAWREAEPAQPAGTQALYICRECGAKYYDKVEPTHPKCPKCLGVCEPTPATGTAQFVIKFFDSLPRCCGYPSCDGDLVGEAHSEECPMHNKPKVPLRDEVVACCEAYHAAQSAADKQQFVRSMKARYELRQQLNAMEAERDEALRKLNHESYVSDKRKQEREAAERQVAELREQLKLSERKVGCALTGLAHAKKES